MIVEYISHKLSRVRWRSCADPLRRSAFENAFVCGTTDESHTGDDGCGSHKNKVMLWSVDLSIEDTVELSSRDEIAFSGDVTQVITFKDKSAFVTSNDGSSHLYEINDSGDQLKEVKAWFDLDKYSCTDAVFIPSSNSVAVCGKEGIVSVVDIVKSDSEPRKCKLLSHTSLECVEHLSSNEVIVGNESGHLKVFDLRTNNAIMSLGNSLCIITCVKKNPSNSHIVASGNDVGVLSLWDLRNNASHLLHISAHNALITELHYKENDDNTIVTSSNNGQLLRWTLSSSSQYQSVDSIMGKAGDSPISSFHINANNEIIFATDSEVLYFGQL